MEDKNIFYVYVYLDPRKQGFFKYGEYEFNYEPFYVGKGNSNRWRRHLTFKFLKENNNRLKENKIQKIINETGKNPIVLKYKENLSDIESKNLEIEMIKNIGRKDLNLGPLTNLTDGGEGRKNIVVSEETKQKLSISGQGRKPWNLGKHLSDEHKEKLKIKRKGRKPALGMKHTEEWKINHSNMLKNRIKDIKEKL